MAVLVVLGLLVVPERLEILASLLIQMNRVVLAVPEVLVCLVYLGCLEILGSLESLAVLENLASLAVRAGLAALEHLVVPELLAHQGDLSHPSLLCLLYRPSGHHRPYHPCRRDAQAFRSCLCNYIAI